jgi:hypothetical protein
VRDDTLPVDFTLSSAGVKGCTTCFDTESGSDKLRLSEVFEVGEFDAG